MTDICVMVLCAAFGALCYWQGLLRGRAEGLKTFQRAIERAKQNRLPRSP